VRRLVIAAATAAAAAALGVAAASAAAPIVRLQLPIVGIGLPGQPPLTSLSSGALGFYKGKMRVRERVVVGVDTDGTPRTVRVVHRIALRGKGDYKLVVPGPIDDVAPFPGEEEQPGLHSDALLWAGFSPGRRTLDAIAHLRVRESVPYLPLMLTVTRTGTEAELRIANQTGASFPALVGDPRPADVARALDEIRASVTKGDIFTNLSVPAPTSGSPASFRVEAPFAVRGTFSAGTRRVPFTAVVGPPHTVRLRGIAPGSMPRVELDAVAVAVPATLRPPGGTSWRDAASGLSGRELVRIADRALLQIELTRKYNEFLEPPLRFAPTTTTYAYRTVAFRPPVAAARPGGGGTSVLVPIVAAVAGVLGLGALAVVWAHS
jgi:hypothetical protein